MAKLHTEFTSDASKTEKDYQKLAREAVKLREENRKLAQQSKQGAKEQESAFAGGIAKAGQMLAGVASVTAVVGFAKEAYAEWRAELDRLGEASKKLSRQMVLDTVAAGRAADSARIESFIGALPGATREQGRAAFAGVSGALPAESTDRVLALTAEVSRAATLVPDLKEFGANVGDLADKFPEMSAADSADLALSIRQRAGDKADVVASDAAMRGVGLLDQAGLASPTEGFALAIEAAKADLAPAMLGALATKAGGTIELGKQASDEAKAIAAADPSARLGMLFGADEATQKEILGDKLATQFRSIDAAAVGRGQTGMAADVAGDHLAAQLAGEAKSSSGDAAQRQQRLDARTDKSIGDKEELERLFDDQRQALDASMAAKGLNPFREWFHRQMLSVGQAGQGMRADPFENPAAALNAAVMGSEAIDFADRQNFNYDQLQARELKEMNANIREQTKLMREQQGIPPTRIEPATQ